MSKNRTVVLSFYDPDGRVDRETLYLLKRLKNNASFLIFVANGKLEQSNDVYKVADEVLIRANLGMDAGAYKHVLFHPRCKDVIRNSDELVLCNSTFYGPFCSMKDIFMHMETNPVDFWGLVRWKDQCEDYIQSYFLVYRKNILLDERFYGYFEEYIDEYTDSRKFVGASFERGLCYHLQECGYSMGAFLDTMMPDIYKYPYECIRVFGLPILKKKCFQKELQLCTIEEIMNSLVYIDRYTEYECQMILESINRLYKWSMCHKDLVSYDIVEKSIMGSHIFCSRQEILSFIDKNSQLYIYGAGMWAESIYYSFFWRNRKERLSGFVVSDGQRKQEEFHGFPVFNYSEVKQNYEIGIIVAMSSENIAQIRQHIREENILYIQKIK